MLAFLISQEERKFIQIYDEGNLHGNKNFPSFVLEARRQEVSGGNEDERSRNVCYLLQLEFKYNFSLSWERWRNFT